MQRTKTRPTRGVTVARNVAFAVLAALAVTWAGYLDLFAGGVWRHWVVPVILLAPVTLVAMTAFVWRERAPRAIGVGAAGLAIFFLFVPWHPRKVFVARLYSIEEGMTVDEVEAILGGYTKGHGWAIPDQPPPHDLGSPEETERVTQELLRDAEARYRPPEYPDGEARAHATGTMIYRWNTTSASYNADWGQVEFVDGKVVAVEFRPD